MLNALSFDLEDWYMVYNYSSLYPFSAWKNLQSRIERNTARLLRLLDSNNTRATFFTLGYVAEKYPDLVKKIYDSGHEVGCHTYRHDIVYTLSREEFDSDLKKCKKVIRKVTGSKIKGFRAPSFSITMKSLWAFDVLKDNGFVYDSSVFPISHPDYGIPGFKVYPSRLKNGLVEAPLSTVKLFKMNFPVAGGAYFRLFPYCLTSRLVKKLNRNFPLFFYMHPWEIDASQPRVHNASRNYKLRHYTNLSKTYNRLHNLIADLEFSRFITCQQYLSVQSSRGNYQLGGE